MTNNTKTTHDSTKHWSVQEFDPKSKNWFDIHYPYRGYEAFDFAYDMKKKEPGKRFRVRNEMGGDRAAVELKLDVKGYIEARIQEYEKRLEEYGANYYNNKDKQIVINTLKMILRAVETGEVVPSWD